MDEKLLKPAEVAEYYGLKVKTIWEWIAKGKLPAIKVGRMYRIKASDLKQIEKGVHDDD